MSPVQVDGDVTMTQAMLAAQRGFNASHGRVRLTAFNGVAFVHDEGTRKRPEDRWLSTCGRFAVSVGATLQPNMAGEEYLHQRADILVVGEIPEPGTTRPKDVQICAILPLDKVERRLNVPESWSPTEVTAPPDVSSTRAAAQTPTKTSARKGRELRATQPAAA